MKPHRLSLFSSVMQRLSLLRRLGNGSGPWFMLGRRLWLLVAMLTLLMTVISVPFAFEHLQSICRQHLCPVYYLSSGNVQQLHVLGLSASFYAAYFLCVLCINFLIWFAVAAVLFWRTSDNRIALLSAFFLVTGAPIAILQIGAQSQLGTLSWKTVVGVLIVLGQYLSDPFLCLFPNGRFVPRWTCVLVLVELVIDFFLLFCALLVPEWYKFLSNGFLVIVLSSITIVCFFTQLYRYKYVSNVVERQQIKWVMFGMIIFVVGDGGPGAVLYQTFRYSSIVLALVCMTGVYLCSICLPISIWIAISRSRLWDIDRILIRTLVYGLLTACVVGMYIVVVSGLSLLFQVQGNFMISLVATGLVAVLFQPLRERLQKGVNRLIYGERDDPSAVLSLLGKSIETASIPEAILPTFVQTIAQTLKLPHVAVMLKQGQEQTPVASYGNPQEECVRFPLMYQSKHVGELVLAQRAPDEPLTPADLRLFDDVARQTGVVAYAVQLTSDLQRSRERLLTTREEERRRLRRDLHDGLGPTLAGLSLKLGAVRNLLTPGQEKIDSLVVELSGEIEQAVSDIRRIVYNLRPPSLDELGLIGAIRSCTVHYQMHLQIAVEMPEVLPILPADIEVAAYRIVQEALNNVARHAQAQSCSVSLSLNNGLWIEVIDDGIGLVKERHIGVGLLAMRERAAELGGTCVIESLSSRGTHIQAYLPLSQE